MVIRKMHRGELKGNVMFTNSSYVQTNCNCANIIKIFSHTSKLKIYYFIKSLIHVINDIILTCI